MRPWQTFLVVAALVPTALVGAIYALFLFWGRDLPSPKRPQEIAPPQNTVLLDRNGDVISELFFENRNSVPLVQIPEVMRGAVLATEDRRFFHHWGVDLRSVGRAVLANVMARDIREGASTITQQLARNVFLTQSQTLERKIREAILAIRLERSFSKEEILELYLNQIYFGDGAYGVESAAQRFFGHSCRELSVAEAAMLAGLPANPAAFSPRRHPEACRRRRSVVLRRMEEAGVIDQETREKAEAAEILGGSRSRQAEEAAYFAETVRLELMDRFGSEVVYGGGLTVHTTLDLRLQRAAVQAMEDQLTAIEQEQALVYRRLRGASVRGDELPPGQRPSYLQGALVALEPQTGAIRAMVGGRDFAESNFNRAVQARRQPGSAFKPFVMAQALRAGYTPEDVLLDAPVTYRWGNQVWSPKNFSHDYKGEVTIRTTLMKSINVPSVRLLEAVGPRKVVELAHELGIAGDLPPQLSLALGTGEVTPLEITSAYGVFANAGIREVPYTIEKIEDHRGNVIEEHQGQPQDVLDEKTSFQMVSMLQSVIDHGTGHPARAKYDFTAPAGGKTGTTDDYSDAWFVGFIPRLACGVWIGFDEKKSIGRRMTGAAAALPAWSAFMNDAVRLYGEQSFGAPAGMTGVTICQESGLLANPGCPRREAHLYKAGNEPTRKCPIHTGARPAVVEEDPETDEAPPEGARSHPEPAVTPSPHEPPPPDVTPRREDQPGREDRPDREDQPDRRDPPGRVDRPDRED